MRVAFIGSRHWIDEQKIRERLAQLTDRDEVVVSDAEGAELITRNLAEEMGIRVEVVEGSWERDMHRSLIQSCDQLEAFIRDESFGTSETVRLAGALSKRVYSWTHP